jgi:hypothetical protein
MKNNVRRVGVDRRLFVAGAAAFVGAPVLPSATPATAGQRAHGARVALRRPPVTVPNELDTASLHRMQPTGAGGLLTPLRVRANGSRGRETPS